MRKLGKFQPVLIAFLSIAVIAGAVAVTQNHRKSIHAASDAYFSLSPTSASYKVGTTFVLFVSETSDSSDNTNAAQANLSYPTSLLQFESTQLSGPFTLCGQNTGGSGSINIGCASPSTVSNTQSIAKITFKVLSSGSAKVAMTSGSDISSSTGNSVWNGVLPSANFTLTAVTTGGGGTTTKKPTGSTTKTPAKPTTATTSHSTSTTTHTVAPSPQSHSSTQPTTTVPTVGSESLGSLSVTVFNSNNKRVNNATVTLDNSQTAYTNSNGVVNFSAVGSGDHSLVIKASGEAAKTIHINLAAGENKLVSETLKPASAVAIYIVGVIVILIAIAAYIIFRTINRGKGIGISAQPPVGNLPIITSDTNKGATIFPTTPTGSPTPTIGASSMEDTESGSDVSNDSYDT